MDRSGSEYWILEDSWWGSWWILEMDPGSWWGLLVLKPYGSQWCILVDPSCCSWQSGLRNTDRLLAHKRPSSPQTGFFPAHRRATSFEAHNLQFLRIQKAGTPLILNSRHMIRMFRERKSDFLQIFEVAPLWATSPVSGLVAHLWATSSPSVFLSPD